jgi:uncharacterized membrane protein HdeD (DUF308 family)
MDTETRDADRTRTADTLEGMLAARAARYWWAVLLAGIAWLVVAWLVLRMDVRSLAAVGVLIGVLFVFAAINDFALASLVTGGWKVLHYVMGALFLLAGIWAFVRPVNTFFALASVLGLILIFYGTFEIARAVSSRDENPYWWIGLVSGILLLLLAFWVSSSDREFNLGARSVLILLWVGFMALFRGISEIMQAFALRRLKTAAGRLPGAADEVPPVPAQRQPSSPERTPSAPNVPTS